MQLKIYALKKDNIKSIKRQSTGWEKIFTKTLKSVFQNIQGILKTVIKTQPIKKWEKHLNRHLIKEDTQMTSNHMKKCSASPVNRELQITTTMLYYCLSIRMAVTPNTGKDVGQQ